MMCAAGCGMCAVPVDGLHKEDMTHEQLLKIQALLKRRIPTGQVTLCASDMSNRFVIP